MEIAELQLRAGSAEANLDQRYFREVLLALNSRRDKVLGRPDALPELLREYDVLLARTAGYLREQQAELFAADIWTNRGIALLEIRETARRWEAVACFDRAIAIRQPRLAPGEVWIAYGLAASWMNKADALTRVGACRDAALQAHDQALRVIALLPDEPIFNQRRAIAWINRGITLETEASLQSDRAAEDSYLHAIAALPEAESAGEKESVQIVAGAWLNLAQVLGRQAEQDTGRIREATANALRLILLFEQLDVKAAEIGIRARLLQCQIMSGTLEKYVTEATDVAEEGLMLAHFWQSLGCNFPVERAALFHFACRVYQEYQPHFLAEFIREQLEQSGTDKTLRTIAFDTAWRHINNLCRAGFGDPNSAEFTEKLNQLQSARLLCEELRRGIESTDRNLS